MRICECGETNFATCTCPDRISFVEKMMALLDAKEKAHEKGEICADPDCEECREKEGTDKNDET